MNRDQRRYWEKFHKMPKGLIPPEMTEDELWESLANPKTDWQEIDHKQKRMREKEAPPLSG